MSRGLIGWLYGHRAGMRHRMLAWPLALALVLAIHGLSIWLLPRLQFNNSPEVYYLDDSPAVLLRDALRRDFPNDEALTVIFQGTDLYTQDILGRLDRLSGNLQRHPLVDRVTTVTAMEKVAGSAEGFSVERLIDLRRLRGATPEQLQQRVLEDRFAPGAMASRDGSVLAVVIRPRPLSQSAERLELKIAVALAINEAGLRAHYAGDAGPVTIDVAQLDSIFGDSKVFVPLTVVIGLSLLWWVVGRWRPVAIGAVSMSTVILPVIAAIAVSGEPYTMATGILPSLLAAYTLATLLHLYAAVQRAQRAGLSRTGAVDRALSETRKPGAFNVLTTGAGLLSLVLVPIPPIQLFGVAGALGTVLVFLTVFFLVPPFLSHWDKRPWPQRSSGMGRLGRIAPRLALFSMRRPKTMVLAFGLLLAAAFPLTQQVKVESDVLAFFAPDHPVSRHTALIESKLSGVTSLEISLVGEGRDSLQSVARLQAMREFQRWLEALPEVDRTLSMADLVEEMNWAMNGEKPESRAIPRNDRLLRQYLLIYDGEDLYELVDREFRHARIVLNLNVHGATEIGQTIGKIRQRLAAEPLPGLKADIGGYGRLFADQVDLLVSGQVNSFAGAFAQIFLLMALLFRSLGASAICLVPNLAPLYFIFVLMGASGIHLDLATVMIAGVILGITVDDTIHLYHGYRERRHAGTAPLLAIARSFESSGRAVLAITVLLVAQFMLLTTSDFIPTANFGLMTAVGLFAGQLAEMLLLPALLVLKDARRSTPKARRAAARVDAVATEWAPTEIYHRAPAGPPAAAPVSQPEFAPPSPAASAPPQGGAMERRVLVCQGNECMACGAATVWQRLNAEKPRLEEPGLGGRVLLTTTSCLGPCEGAPVVQVYPGGRYFRGPDAVRLVRSVCDHLLPPATQARPAAVPSGPQPEEAS